MSESQLPQVGDVVAARVTKVVPFGALVDVAGTPGLLVVTPQPPVGAELRVRVASADAARGRVSVEMA